VNQFFSMSDPRSSETHSGKLRKPSAMRSVQSRKRPVLRSGHSWKLIFILGLLSVRF